MISCGLQCLTCDYPINLDTYRGCSHNCLYCFVKQKHTIDTVEPLSSVTQLKHFIEGKRGCDTRWCDWDIPLHFGGNTDPFQECEREHKISLECLKIFAESKYPFIISTKNPVMLTEEPYLSLIKQCNVVVQCSMSCSKYDKLEKGAPTYKERLAAMDFLKDKVPRTIARVSPYFPDCHKEICAEIPNMAKSGIHGISISSLITKKKTKGMKRYGTNYMFDLDLLAPKYRQLKQICHDNGMKFYCCEDGLEHWSDSLSCCGTDGLDGFTPNTYNVGHIAIDSKTPEPTEAMKRNDTYRPFKAIGQSQVFAQKVYNKSFADLILECGSNRIEYCRQQCELYKE